MAKDYIAITGGGTGGHLMVADAIINELHSRGIGVIFVGSTNGQDKQWFENSSKIDKAIFLETRGVVNKNLLGKFTSMANMISKALKVIKHFNQYKVKKVVSVGGYSAAPATFAAILSRRELFIHEQNSVMGSLNRYSAPFAKYIFNSFDSKCEIDAYPVKPEFFEKARIREDVKQIIFLGGSQGAVFINNFALSVSQKLKEMGISIVHQAGKNDFERVEAEYKKLGIQADVFAFSSDIPQKMANSDFAISRAGASTLWELTANALPSLYIPFPFAAKDHQYTNAKFLVDKGVAFVKRESELKDQYLFEILENENINQISKKLSDNITPNGVKMIVDKIISE